MFDASVAVHSLVEEIKRFFEKAGFKKAVIGLSGGVDSSVTCALAVRALGKENVVGISMPELGLSSDASVRDAKELAEELGIIIIDQPINKILDGYELGFDMSTIAAMNLKARVRANILYTYANSTSSLVLGTGNKTEILMGYATKYGDAACDVLPIGELFKVQVWEVAKALGIPEVIITKKPSAELAPGQFDEDELGYSYQELDKMLMENSIPDDLKERIEKNKHKAHAPPVLRF